MKTLYLVRHAKSDKDIPGIKDRERPLNRRGKKDAAAMGRLLKKRGIFAQAMYTSPAKRALDTAGVIAKALGFPRKKIKPVASMYDSRIFKLARVVRKMDDRAASSVIFGHNPEFLDLINYLTPRRVKKFPTCGVFGVAFPVDSWKKVARKKGKIVFIQVPGGNA